MANENVHRIHPGKRGLHRGRGKTGPPFVQILHRITDTEEFGRLTGNALKLMVEIACQYRGWNNGDLSIPWSRLKDRGWRSKATVHAAKMELLEGGWIIETRKGGRHTCSLYALSYYPIDESEKHQEPATPTAPNLWQQKRAA